MAFDTDLCLCDGSADWTYANLVSSDYGTPTSTTRNAGGFIVLDMKESAADGVSIVLICSASANASDDALTVLVQQCASSAFGSAVSTLAAFDVAAATNGIILGSECPVTVIRRVQVTKRYLRIDASCTAADDFGAVYCYVQPWAFKKL